jgi:serine/threonine-protein kinase
VFLAIGLPLVVLALLPRAPHEGPWPILPQGYSPVSSFENGALPAAIRRDRDKTKFSRIAGGTFRMGDDGFARGPADADDRPAHPVTLSDYYLQETEVTNGELDDYFRDIHVDRSARPARFQEAWDLIFKAGRDPRPFPAVGISHALAEAYAKWVGGKLPTEAQWEYAARSRGKTRAFVWEADQKPNRRLANIASRGTHEYLLTNEVGVNRSDRTEQGILDLTGNVREWCRDRWAPYRASEQPLVDPVAAGPGTPGALDFVIRGGSYDSFADLFRTTRPRRVGPEDRPTYEQLAADQAADDVGFRVVIEWPRKP